MLKAILSDFSRTLLFPKDASYQESLNKLYSTVKETKDFNFFDHFTWNQELEDFYADLSLKMDISINIFTTETIQEDPALENILCRTFSNIFKVSDINGLKKDNPAAYIKICSLLDLKPEEVLFIDDSMVNIKAAEEAGLMVMQYTSVATLKNKLLKTSS